MLVGTESDVAAMADFVAGDVPDVPKTAYSCFNRMHDKAQSSVLLLSAADKRGIGLVSKSKQVVLETVVTMIACEFALSNPQARRGEHLE